MKLYVWQDVLCDYTCGMIVALAPDLETAVGLVEEGYIRADMGKVQPLVVEIGPDTKPAAWYVYGGG